MKTTTSDKAVLTDKETFKEVVDCLTENLSIKTQGDCQLTDLFNILVGAASKADTIENTASTFQNSFVAIISYLLAKANSLNLKIKSLYLDRGFYSSSVIRWLMALDIPLIMPAIRNGKTGGIKQYLQGRKSNKTTHTMNQDQENEVTFDLWIVCKYLKGKRGKFGIEYLAYVVDKVALNLDYIHQDYRKRFGIETSYRLKNICRIRTTTKNPIIRLLFVGISFLLVNIWIYILWSKISKPRRGGRLVYNYLFPFKQMIAFLSNVVNQIYGVREIVYIPSS